MSPSALATEIIRSSSGASPSEDDSLSSFVSKLGDLFRGPSTDPLQSLETRIMQVLIRGEKALPEISRELDRRFDADYGAGEIVTALRRLRYKGAVEVSRYGKIEGSDRVWRFFKLTGAGAKQLNQARQSSVDLSTELGFEPG